ncbi:helix-turn-helix domain-containing protein [Nocardioides sp. LHD-245]|uniref:TetR/AcrR family transcriptional regulator n=1 Tax=Nocardioides sp. LHD-245 TaxID=3051387 RepID=UPI0027DF17F8|nr:helix-turn-helix domain-containing protein [Nocardioides sp. LHD-245]
MGRSVVHTHNTLLDAAVELFAAGGARAVTMSAVARAAGAPSGSVYHRFPDRGTLLADLWLRTATRFEAAYHDRLGETPSPETAVDAAAWIVTWCRAEPASAAVLQAGPTAFDPDTWPPGRAAELVAARDRRDVALGAAVGSVATATGVPVDEVSFALLGLPLAVAGQYLRAAEPVPADAVDLVSRLAARVLGLT